MSRSALLFATTPSTDGGPAAVLGLDGSTLIGRLLSQLETLGIRRFWVVTRPAWAGAVQEAARHSGAAVTVVASGDLGEDLEATARIAAGAPGGLVVGRADALTHREALAGLLADPRIVSGILATSSRARGRWAFRVRNTRGRVVSAASPYHRVQLPNGHFLGFLKIEPADRQDLVSAAAALAEIARQGPPERWEEELERNAAAWRRELWNAAVRRETGMAPAATDGADPAALPLDDAAEEELALRIRVAREDVVALLLVGLVRAGVPLASSNLRGFFYARPLSAEAARLALEEMSSSDEERVALDSAVKASDGFFTTFLVSPYSKYIARFAARRGWTPTAVTSVSMLIGALAAASFALGTRPGLVAGAVLLQAAFTLDCVDGQLARYTRTFTKLGAWLDSVLDRLKEYLVYAGLAYGSVRGFGDDVWTLAAAALTLQTVRHMIGFSYAAGQSEAIALTPHLPLEQPEDAPLPTDLPSPAVERVARTVDPEPQPGATAVATQTRGPGVAAPAAQPAKAPPAQPAWRRLLAVLGRRAVRLAGALERWRWARWAKRILLLPIGERFALISLTAALATPRVTFVALLAWGAVAGTYNLAGRLLRSVAR